MQELMVNVLDVGYKRVVVKVGRQRKPRNLIAFWVGDKIVAQGGGMVFEVDPETCEAVYNLRGQYFVYLSPLLGSERAIVPKEFVESLKKVAIKEGDVIGVLPNGSPIVFGGGSEWK